MNEEISLEEGMLLYTEAEYLALQQKFAPLQAKLEQEIAKSSQLEKEIAELHTEIDWLMNSWPV